MFGYAKSLPSSPIEGQLPGTGQEHGTADAAAGTVQLEEVSTILGRLTQGSVDPKPAPEGERGSGGGENRPGRLFIGSLGLSIRRQGVIFGRRAAYPMAP